MNNKVSVCIATYNGEQFIYEQLCSILSQLNENDEIIVSDDGSTDHTLKIITDIQDDRIRVFTNKGKKGPIFNFENALLHATGELIFLSDQDDIWSPNKVLKSSLALEHADFVFTNAEIIDKRGEKLRNLIFNTIPPRSVIPNLIFNHFFGATIAFKKEILKKALPFPSYIPMHDQWLGIIASYFYKVNYINEPLIKYRRHGANASFCGEKSANTLWKKLLFRFNIIRALLHRLV